MAIWRNGGQHNAIITLKALALNPDRFPQDYEPETGSDCAFAQCSKASTQSRSCISIFAGRATILIAEPLHYKKVKHLVAEQAHFCEYICPTIH
ncbi:hypothetical protein [Pseudochrobactrum sp. HB0163]|uniref:hypothetical protein n=1 Tax=Pseudochrobactrum sp. HB0163 TaxID=3450708 RepID=UPI003F6DC476